MLWLLPLTNMGKLPNCAWASQLQKYYGAAERLWVHAAAAAHEQFSFQDHLQKTCPKIVLMRVSGDEWKTVMHVQLGGFLFAYAQESCALKIEIFLFWIGYTTWHVQNVVETKESCYG
jgi:hypothetical protein